MSWRSSVAIARPMSRTLVRWFSRAPSCWIDWSCAVQVAICWKFWAVRIATLAWVASDAMVSSSSRDQACGVSW